MRIILIVIVVIGYLFSLVYIESALVQLEMRKEKLRNQLNELKNRRKDFELEVMSLTNLARIETEAKARGFIFPTQDDILGVIDASTIRP